MSRTEASRRPAWNNATELCKLLDRTVFENRNGARLAIFDFIEAFHNPWRRHSSIGDLSLVEFERRWHAKSHSCDAA